MPLAHVLAPSAGPVWAQWLSGLALFGGLLGVAVWWRRPERRAACGAIAGAGLVATAALLVAQPSLPLRPAYGIALVAPPQATSPVMLRLCATSAGSAVAPATSPSVPEPGQLLLLRVDGRQVAEARSSTVVVTMSPGEHHVFAELLTSDHRAYAPPVTATTTVTVSRPGPLGTPAPCVQR